MVDLAAVSGLTAHERRMLAKMLTTVANGGVASVTNEPTATAHNRAFVDLLRDLTEAGLLTVKSGASENGTGSLVAAAETEVALEAIAAAAGAGGDDLTVAIGSAMSPEAVASRQEASAERAARIAAIQANRLPAGTPPPPGYNREMQVVDPALAFPGAAADGSQRNERAKRRAGDEPRHAPVGAHLGAGGARLRPERGVPRPDAAAPAAVGRDRRARVADRVDRP